jgi:hypothetical protein
MPWLWCLPAAACVVAQAPVLGAGEISRRAAKPLDRAAIVSNVHMELSGQQGCSRCHDEAQDPNDGKCLDCHTEIQAALDRGRGYHPNVVIRDHRPCESCHREHEGTAGKLATWQNDAGMRAFDHGSTGYALEGGHAGIDCRRCHRPQFLRADASRRARPEESFLGLTTACVGCHQDVHMPSRGRECERCHAVQDWSEPLPGARFVGAAAEAGLIGLRNCVPAHAGRDVCRTCHPSGARAGGLPNGACEDCHADAHRGQFKDRRDGGRCEACHDVLGFDSVLFGVAEHRDTAFPLEGAHRAVSCRACHKRESVDGVEMLRFDIEARRCADCHTNPPAGHIVEIADRFTCSDCHAVASWQQVAFDHGRAGFRLTGRHTTVACVRCHQKADAGTPQERVRYADLGQNCAACHVDAHARQFAQRRCEDCHTPDDWRPRLFDHQRDASFALEGQHRNADCHACHREETGPDGKPLRRFRPLSTKCRACHDERGGVLPVFAKDP